MRLESAGLDNFWTKGSCIGPDLFASDLVKAGKVDPRLEPKIGIPRAVFRDDIILLENESLQCILS